VTWWHRKRKEPRDQHREFIYLDEVSVVSLLASLQGEIKESVTNTLTQTDEAALTSSMSGPKSVFSIQSKIGSTQSSAREVVRRAVIQSTFRDLWRSDVGVLLHDTESTGRRIRRPKISTLPELRRELKKLRKEKLAADLADIKRGTLLEMDIRLEADRFFKIVTIGTNLLDLIEGKEDLFGSAIDETKRVSSIIQVLKELSVGLVPVRGISQSHCVIELDGANLVLAKEVLAPGGELISAARELELVGFTETDSYWRDLRRTLFSGSIYTAYMRVEKGVNNLRWSPIKIADLFDEVTPGLGETITSSLQELQAATSRPSPISGISQLSDLVKLHGFAEDLAAELTITPDPEAVRSGIEKATSVLSKTSSVTDRRRAYDLIVDIVADSDVDREVVRYVRDRWIDRVEVSRVTEQPQSTSEDGTALPVQVEVGFVALYW